MEENKKAIKFNVMAIILIIVFCFAITPISFQNDTFYTIKIGQYVLENGATMQETFSWNESIKEYTFPHWAYDVATYLVYNMAGYLGIYIATIVFCIILGILIYFVNCKLTENRLTSFVLTIIAMYLLQNYITARVQLVTFSLFILTIYFIESFLKSGKKRYGIGLIIIPIIIANIHVAVFPFYFILYLPYIGEYFIYRLLNINIDINKLRIKKIHKKTLKTNDKLKMQQLNERLIKFEARINLLKQRNENANKKSYKIVINPSKYIKTLIIIMIICIFTGLITPLGLTPYTYLIKTMQGNTTQNISEHLPLVLINNLNYMIMLICFLAVLTFTDTKIKLCDLFMLGGLTLLTFYTRRQESIFIIICVLIFNKLLCTMFSKYDPDGSKKMETWMSNNILGIITTTGIILIIGISLYKPKIDNQYVSESSYPVKASEWILNNLDIKKIKLYNEYNYGSYLLFKGIPVFIDSRAELYTPEFNKDINVFSDFLNLSNLNLNTQQIEKKFDEYGITHLILYKNGSKTKLAQYIELNIDKYSCIYPTEQCKDDNFYIFERK